MTYTAVITRQSAIWKQWTASNRLGGELWGVTFHWVPGGDFATEVLSTEEVAALSDREGVTLEARAEPVPTEVESKPQHTSHSRSQHTPHRAGPGPSREA